MNNLKNHNRHYYECRKMFCSERNMYIILQIDLSQYVDVYGCIKMTIIKILMVILLFVSELQYA